MAIQAENYSVISIKPYHSKALTVISFKDLMEFWRAIYNLLVRNRKTICGITFITFNIPYAPQGTNLGTYDYRACLTLSEETWETPNEHSRHPRRSFSRKFARVSDVFNEYLLTP